MAATICSTSLPARYLRFGFLAVAASTTTFAAELASEPFSSILFTVDDIICIIGEYGELGSCAFFAMTMSLAKFVLTIPVDQLADQQIWEELQKKGYNFPFYGKKYYFMDEAARWFDALHLAIQRLRSEIGA